MSDPFQGSPEDLFYVIGEEAVHPRTRLEKSLYKVPIDWKSEKICDFGRDPLTVIHVTTGNVDYRALRASLSRGKLGAAFESLRPDSFDYFSVGGSEDEAGRSNRERIEKSEEDRLDRIRESLRRSEEIGRESKSLIAELVRRSA